MSQAILKRDNAQAVLEGNLENAAETLFASAARGDLHLAPASAAIGKGVKLASGLAGLDMDGDARDDIPDVGADEYVKPASYIRRTGAGRSRGGCKNRDESRISGMFDFGGEALGQARHRADGRRVGVVEDPIGDDLRIAPQAPP